jgi:hypothetical protein
MKGQTRPAGVIIRVAKGGDGEGRFAGAEAGLARGGRPEHEVADRAIAKGEVAAVTLPPVSSLRGR